MDLLTEAEGFWADHLYAQWESGAWHAQAAEDRTYGHRHLAEHLDAASRPSALLYSLVSAEWMRGWYELEDGYAGFLSDVDRAWARADRAIGSEARTSLDLLMQAKCSLCHSSVVSLASRVHPDLFAPFIAHGVLSFERALDIAQRARAGMARADVWKALTPLMPDEHQESTVRVASLIHPPGERATVLCGLIPRLQPSTANRAWHVALDAARQENEPYGRRNALRDVVQHAPAGVASAALAAAREVSDYERGHAIAGLVPRLPEPLLTDAFDAAMTVSDDSSSRFAALIAIVERLPSQRRPPVVAAALDAALRNRHVDMWARSLSSLAPFLSKRARRKALRDALEQAKKRERYDEVLNGLVQVFDAGELAQVAKIPPKHDAGRPTPEAMIALIEIESEHTRRNALRDALESPGEVNLRLAVRVARSFRDLGLRADAFALLLQRWPRRPGLGAEALACARSLRDAGARVDAMLELLPNLSSALKNTALDAIVRLLPRMSDSNARDRAAYILVQSSPRDRVVELLGRAVKAAGSYSAAGAFVDGATRLPRTQVRRAVRIAERIEDPRDRARALAGLAARLHSSAATALYRRAFEASAEVADAPERTELSRCLADSPAKSEARSHRPPMTRRSASLDPEDARARYDAAMKDPGVLDDEIGWILKTQDLVPSLLPELRREATWNIRCVMWAAALDRDDLSRAFVGLAPLIRYLKEPEAQRAREDAVEAASALREGRWQGRALTELVPHLPEPVRGRAARGALDAVRYTAHEEDQHPVLTGLAPHLAGELLGPAIIDALALENLRYRGEALEALADRLVDLAATDRAAVHDAWTVALRHLAAFPRGEAVQAFTKLARVATTLSSDATVFPRLAGTVDEIAAWWP